jgi:cell division protein FtsB
MGQLETRVTECEKDRFNQAIKVTRLEFEVEDCKKDRAELTQKITSIETQVTTLEQKTQ